MTSTPSSQLVIFGGTGDLALRKLQPALYKLQREGLMNDVCAIIALGRGDSSDEEYRALVKDKMREFLPKHFWDEQHWQAFSAKLHFISLDVNSLKDYHNLADAIHQHPNSNAVFYLATSSTLYTSICRNFFFPL